MPGAEEAITESSLDADAYRLNSTHTADAHHTVVTETLTLLAVSSIVV